MNVIANKKATNEWYICKIDGREHSEGLSKLAKDEEFFKLYEEYDLNSQYFKYYRLKELPE